MDDDVQPKELVPVPTDDFAAAKRLQQGGIMVRYRNWRGETRVRKIRPIEVWYGCTRWHPHWQYLLKAWDDEDHMIKNFALCDCDFISTGESEGEKISAMDVECSGKKYLVVGARNHKVLKEGDVVSMTEVPSNYENVLYRHSDGKLCALQDEYDQYVDLMALS